MAFITCVVYLSISLLLLGENPVNVAGWNVSSFTKCSVLTLCSCATFSQRFLTHLFPLMKDYSLPDELNEVY